MRRLRKKRPGRPAKRRQVGQRKADLVAQSLDEWRTKWRPVAQKYTTPRKLRGNEMMWSVRDAIELINDYPHYFELTFWHDLEKKGVDFPFYLPFLLAELSRKPSELLRAIADYIDAYKDKARASRLEATEKLYDYAEQVMSRRAK